jgi:lipoprotein-releasing system permease protein
MTTFVAWRYLRSKKTTNAINLIAWISMIAIGVVTAALVVVLSVFNGFEDLVKQMYGDFYADVQVLPAKGKWMETPSALRQKIGALKGVEQVEGIIEERAILLDQEEKSIVWLKGVSSDYSAFTGTADHMIRGVFSVGDSTRPGLVVGAGVERSLQIIAGQSPFPVTVYLPNPEAGASADAMTAMLSGNVMASGSFAVQQEFDEQYAFTHIGFMRYMLGESPNRFTSFEVYLKPGTGITDITSGIRKILGKDYVVKNRFQQNQSLFAAMQTEKLIIYAIAFLILIIAGFNIISSLTMTILEKQKDIAVLKAMGTTDAQITRIFVKLGVMLSGAGAISGFILGLIICLGQQYFKWVSLGGQSFVISYYPVSIHLSDLLGIGAIVLVTALLAAWFPARRSVHTTYSLR